MDDPERVAVGVITSSFAAAASQAGVTYDIVDELVDLFGDRIIFHRDFRVGDSRIGDLLRNAVDCGGVWR